MERNEIVELLKTSEAIVKFVKKDGTIRELHCTLKSDVIVSYEKKTERVRAKNDDQISVWDLENNGWRSFNIDSVLEVYAI